MGAGMAIAPIVGMMSDAINSNRQQKNNRELQDRQYDYQRKLNEQGMQIGKDMWDYTNYGNTTKHMRDAGLNVGMMYGGAGGGTSGSTATPSGGSASGGGSAGMATGMSNSISSMAQLGVMEANKKALEAGANKAQAEADQINGVGKENVVADTGAKNAQAGLVNLQAENQKTLNGITKETADDAIGTIKANYSKAEGEASKAVSEGKYSEEQFKANVAKTQADTASAIMSAEAMKAGIKLTNEQTRAIAENLAQGWEELYQKSRSNDAQQSQANIAEFRAKFEKALGEANVDLRAKELMIKGAEAFVNSIKGTGSKTTTTETTREMRDGSTRGTYTRQTTR